MNYCTRCVLPDTRPNLVLDNDGICNACKNHGMKRSINWQDREKQFEKVVEYAKKRSKGYDCLIPVSGGKDSTWQAVKCLEYGLNPLAVTWKTPGRTQIGYLNLQNLINLGVDHIDYSINPEVEKIFMVNALKKCGSAAIPMHMAIFNIPLKIALEFDIPLVVWGENSAFEYGGGVESREGFKLDSNWIRKYGVMDGTTAQDWVDEKLTRQKLTPYFGPSPELLEQKGIRAVFLGYYFQWDVYNVYKIASEHGFKPRSEGSKTGLYDYADIDDDYISIHHFVKWYKFGFSRLFDNLSLEIRNNRITRRGAIKIINDTGPQVPYEDINDFCKFTGLTEGGFYEIIEKFRNRSIWFQQDGKWKIKDFIIPDWKYWDEFASIAKK